MAKITVVGLRGIPGVMGGIETHCEQLYPRLKSLRPLDDILVIARKRYVRRGPYTFGNVQVLGLWHGRHKYLEAITNTLVGVLYARFSIRSDLVHLHGIGPALVAPLARLLGVRVVVTHHGQDYRRSKWNPVARAFLQFGEVCAVASADALIVVSPSLTEQLKARYPGRAGRIHYIPNGANHVDRAPPTPSEARAVPSRFGLEPGGYVLAVGRLVPEKGFHDLVAAYRAAGIGAKLAIVGAADHRDAYSEALEAEADERVVFTGSLSHGEVRALLGTAALFVLPSYHEGLPIAALEAIHAGTPVLLSDIEPNKDLRLPPGHYFRVGDVADLAAKLMASSDRLRLSADTAERSLEAFDWDRISTATDAIYAAVQKGQDPTPALGDQ